MSELPTGTVTFLFTDIEGSTRLWEQHPEAMAVAVARHDDLIRTALESRGGYVFSTAGDSFAAAFSSAGEAVEAAVAAQLAISAEEWGETPVRVRMGLHTGMVGERAGDYFGPVVNEAARLMSAAHGGQVLASTQTAGVLPRDVELVELGEVRLRDVNHPISVVQVTHPDLDAIFPSLRGLATTPNNLPRQLTSFVGREQELDELAELMGESRLVTLVGAGGSGKTRLAQEYAAGVLDEYPDGVWLVDLAVVDDPDLVPGVVALTVGVGEAPGGSIVDRLVERLEHRETLLLLDNCEHLVEPVGSLVVELLKGTGAVRVMATSRQTLGIGGEHPYAVPPLPVPREDVTDPGMLDSYPAVRLLVDRAETARPGFKVTAANAGAVSQICRRLDGLPLAVELAAARFNILTAEELERLLDDRFAILTGGARDELPHHQTLEATLDWSYQLLTEKEQTLLNRLSAFAGGFTLDACQRVCTGDAALPEWALDLVSSLVDKSLLVSQDGAAGRRFRLLETIGEYAAVRLGESGESDDMLRRHAEYYRQLAVDARPHLWGPDEVECLDRLDEEWPNLRRALQWHLDTNHVPEGLPMLWALESVYERRYHLEEGLDWMRRYIERGPVTALDRARYRCWTETLDETGWHEVMDVFRRSGSKRDLAWALMEAAQAALQRQDWDAARAFVDESFSLPQEERFRCMELITASQVAAAADRDPLRAAAMVREALPLAREGGSPEMLAYVLRFVGVWTRDAGDLDEAETALLAAQRLERDLGGRYGAPGWTEMNLAQVALDRGDTRAAVHHLLEYEDLMRPLLHEDSNAWDSAHAILLQWARLAVATGKYETAVVLLGAGETFGAESGYLHGWPTWVEEIERTLAAARQHIDPHRFDAAWNQGLAMTSTEALDYAVTTLTRNRASTGNLR